MTIHGHMTGTRSTGMRSRLRATPPSGMVGVLGGMGPLATADFMVKVIAGTPATCDQEHVPMIVQSVPQIPDRSAAILTRSDSPLPHLVEGLARLEAAGAGVIAVPCNTAHHWYAALESEARVPILHIADAACDALEARGFMPGATVALLATAGTIASGFYQARLEARGYLLANGGSDEHERLVQRGIAQTKAGDLAAAAASFEAVLSKLRSAGANAVILACTEIPVALDRANSPSKSFTIDSTRALAQRCVEWWLVHCRSSAS